MIRQLLLREWTLCVRKKGETLQPLLFFMVIVSLFPLAWTPNVAALPMLGIGVMWMALLLANMLALPSLFVPELADGSLEQWCLADLSLTTWVWLKLLVQAGILLIPVLVFLPCFALLYHVNTAALGVLSLSLILGVPILVFLGGMIAALLASLPQAGMLLVLILLPFYVPTLIFATGMVNAAIQGLAFRGPLCLLLALDCLALTVAPIVTAAILRLGVKFL